MVGWLILDGLLALSGLGIGIFWVRSCQSLAGASRLEPVDLAEIPARSIAVVIPAYNEEVNIVDCVRSVLASELPDAVELQVWVADDQSSDRTLALAAALMPTDARLRVLRVPPRPTEQLWLGKNWACVQVTEAIGETVDYLLFIDADVRLAPGAIGAALTLADRQQIDLLSCAPLLVCGCLSEWLVQPIVASAMAIAFDFRTLNDPESPTAFAAGPFMFFRRSSYAAIGGHAAVGHELTEDLALARQIRQSGRSLHFALGLGLMRVRMYQNFAALWEGWTKHWHIANQNNIPKTLISAAGLFGVFAMPWLGLLIGAIRLLIDGPSPLGFVSFGLALATTIAVCGMRWAIAQQTDQSLRYWWLMGVGGVLVVAIAIASIIKVETGWGWTWRGRPLTQSS